MAKAIQGSAARCYAIMPDGDDTGRPNTRTEAVRAAIEASGGIVFPMPQPVPRSRPDM